jgi:hypothetical protein
MMMIYFLALIPATALTIAGYFVLFLSGRSEGGFRTFGKYLGFWAFTLAGLVVLGAIFAAAHGGHHRHGPWSGEPRNFGPHRDEFRGPVPPNEPAGGAPPQAPAGAANPSPAHP